MYWNYVPKITLYINDEQLLINDYYLWFIFYEKMGYPTKYEWELNHWILNIIDLFNVKLDVKKKKE